jgi:hypothetical protein
MSTEQNKSAAPNPRPESNPGRGKGRPQSGTRTGPPKGDGRHDASQLQRNKESLRVGEDHKTPEMKKHRRGTFP